MLVDDARAGASATQQTSTKTRLRDTRPGECFDQRQNSDYTGTGSWLVGSLARQNEHEYEQRDHHREAPKGLHGLIAGSGERLDHSYRGDRAAEHPEHRGAPDLIPRWLHHRRVVRMILLHRAVEQRPGAVAATDRGLILSQPYENPSKASGETTHVGAAAGRNSRGAA